MKKQISRKRKLSFLDTTQGEFRDHHHNEDQDIVAEESSISVAVRHAQACRGVHKQCVLLKSVLDMAFLVKSYLSLSSSPLSQQLLQQQNQVSSLHVTATSGRIDYAISLALSLLSNKELIPPLHGQHIFIHRHISMRVRPKQKTCPFQQCHCHLPNNLWIERLQPFPTLQATNNNNNNEVLLVFKAALIVKALIWLHHHILN
eukprot:2358374-Ditylum_brightwellii.AAC.1